MNKKKRKAYLGTEKTARGRWLYAASVLGALALSLAAADAMLSKLLDSIAVMAGILAVRVPPPPSETGDMGRVSIHKACFKGDGNPFIGHHHLN